MLAGFLPRTHRNQTAAERRVTTRLPTLDEAGADTAVSARPSIVAQTFMTLFERKGGPKGDGKGKGKPKGYPLDAMFMQDPRDGR